MSVKCRKHCCFVDHLVRAHWGRLAVQCFRVFDWPEVPAQPSPSAPSAQVRCRDRARYICSVPSICVPPDVGACRLRARAECSVERLPSTMFPRRRSSAHTLLRSFNIKIIALISTWNIVRMDKWCGKSLRLERGADSSGLADDGDRARSTPIKKRSMFPQRSGKWTR